jgi:hypothetical protein
MVDVALKGTNAASDFWTAIRSLTKLRSAGIAEGVSLSVSFDLSQLRLSRSSVHFGDLGDLLRRFRAPGDPGFRRD